ncbi:Putative epoxide hydrolase [Cladobotryum mycophilum]|uniref:Epoxide hydrolase n=1 Tax=Cladobotryum mycophilum TaxID=491253 RepID=A0ABR0SQP7_9HYPO
MPSLFNKPPSAIQRPDEFTVSVPEAKLQELKQLIQLSRLGPVTYESSQQNRKYGLTTEWLSNAREQWKTFSWRQVEDSINSFPNFMAHIEDDGTVFDVHFMAIFSECPDAVPVLMLHGWPGSFLEFIPIFRLLTDAYTPATLPYHLVVPSIPGYAFSSAPPLDRDFRLEDAARIVDHLMVQLGFGDGYVVQGGDVGSKIARVLGGTCPRTKAVHLNFCIMPDPGHISGTDYNDLDKEGIARATEFIRTGSAYALEHATRPSTIGLALSSSPLALLAWIGEKFLDWTDLDPPLDTILESVTLYWLTDCFSTSLWPYRQLFVPGCVGAHENPIWHIHKPLGFSWFPKEIAPVPKSWAETTGNLVFFKQHHSGGHFAALERPDILLKDVEEFVAQVWSRARG